MRRIARLDSSVLTVTAPPSAPQMLPDRTVRRRASHTKCRGYSVVNGRPSAFIPGNATTASLVPGAPMAVP
jgi:hypothetical protein